MPNDLNRLLQHLVGDVRIGLFRLRSWFLGGVAALHIDKASIPLLSAKMVGRDHRQGLGAE